MTGKEGTGIKLLNRTKIKDKLHKDVLLAAGRAVRTRTSDVLVQVNPGLYGSSGAAYECVGIKAAEKIGVKRECGKLMAGRSELPFRHDFPTR